MHRPHTCTTQNRLLCEYYNICDDVPRTFAVLAELYVYCQLLFALYSKVIDLLLMEAEGLADFEEVLVFINESLSEPETYLFLAFLFLICKYFPSLQNLGVYLIGASSENGIGYLDSKFV